MARAPKENVDGEAGEAGKGKPAMTFVGKKKLVEAVVAASGVKAKTAKPVIEATLAEIGNILSRGENLSVQPLGKVIINKTKETERADIQILRLRRNKPGLAPRKAKAKIEAEAAAADAVEAAE